MNEEIRFPTGARPDKKWLFYALITVIFWGIWGAFSSISAQNGFPDTLVYCVWAITMIVPTIIVLQRGGWKIDKSFKAIWQGLTIGLLGAGGQMILFYALTIGPAYYIFPIISVSPLVTIVLSTLILKERTNLMGIIGVIISLIALPMFDFSFGQTAGGGNWFLLALLIMLFWGVQGFFMKSANEHMSGESIFFYMTLSGILIIPFAIFMTDFGKPINWGLNGPYLAAAIQILNSIGALTLVFAFRHGKAMIVSPLTNAGAPLLTAIISLLVAGVVPGGLKILGLILATIASILLALAG